MHVERVLDLSEVPVELSTEVDQQAIVREFEKRLGGVFGRLRRGQGRNGQVIELHGFGCRYMGMLPSLCNYCKHIS